LRGFVINADGNCGHCDTLPEKRMLPAPYCDCQVELYL
jgi:hypothetical protein